MFRFFIIGRDSFGGFGPRTPPPQYTPMLNAHRLSKTLQKFLRTAISPPQYSSASSFFKVRVIEQNGLRTGRSLAYRNSACAQVRTQRTLMLAYTHNGIYFKRLEEQRARAVT